MCLVSARTKDLNFIWKDPYHFTPKNLNTAAVQMLGKWWEIVNYAAYAMETRLPGVTVVVDIVGNGEANVTYVTKKLGYPLWGIGIACRGVSARGGVLKNNTNAALFNNSIETNDGIVFCCSYGKDIQLSKQMHRLLSDIYICGKSDKLGLNMFFYRGFPSQKTPYQEVVKEMMNAVNVVEGDNHILKKEMHMDDDRPSVIPRLMDPVVLDDFLLAMDNLST